jgi:hypothetical protein
LKVPSPEGRGRAREGESNFSSTAPPWVGLLAKTISPSREEDNYGKALGTMEDGVSGAGKA